MSERTIEITDRFKDRLTAERVDADVVVYVNGGTGVFLNPTQVDALVAWLEGEDTDADTCPLCEHSCNGACDQ